MTECVYILRLVIADRPKFPFLGGPRRPFPIERRFVPSSTMSIVAIPPCDEAVIRASEASAPCRSYSEAWILAATILGSSMSFIDGTVVNVALPVLQADLKATVADVQWVVEAYALFLSALILVGGSLGDRYGRRRIFAIGIALFTAASVGCGLAQTTLELIVARAVQGVGGALLVPGSLAIISASFTEEKRGRAIGTWSGFSAITAGFGPLFGGFLIEHVSWRAIFFINVPIAVVVLAILFRHVPESRDESAARLDLVGAVLCTFGLGGIVYGLIESSVLSFSDPVVIASLVLGVIILIAFVYAEAHSSAPMMPLDLFRSRNFSGANILTLLLYGGLGGALFFVPFDLIRVQGYSATAAGAAFLPFILLMFLLSRWSGGLVTRFGGKLPLVVGPIIAAAGMALFARPDIGGSYWTTFFPASVVLGLGMTIAVAPLTTVVMGAVESRHAGIASGINNAASRAASLIAIAALSVVAVQEFAHSLDGRLNSLRVSPHLYQLIDAQRTRLADARVPSVVTGHARTALHRAIAESFVSSFRLAVLIGAAMALASALTAAVMIEGKPSGETAAVLQPEREKEAAQEATA